MKREREFEQIVAIVNDGNVCFRFEDGRKADAPGEAVNNSKLLREALCAAPDGHEIPLQAPQGMLQSWLRCGEQNQPFGIQFLQVRILSVIERILAFTSCRYPWRKKIPWTVEEFTLQHVQDSAARNLHCTQDVRRHHKCMNTSMILWLVSCALHLARYVPAGQGCLLKWTACHDTQVAGFLNY